MGHPTRGDIPTGRSIGATHTRYMAATINDNGTHLLRLFFNCLTDTSDDFYIRESPILNVVCFALKEYAAGFAHTKTTTLSHAVNESMAASLCHVVYILYCCITVGET